LLCRPTRGMASLPDSATLRRPWASKSMPSASWVPMALCCRRLAGTSVVPCAASMDNGSRMDSRKGMARHCTRALARAGCWEATPSSSRHSQKPRPDLLSSLGRNGAPRVCGIRTDRSPVPRLESLSPHCRSVSHYGMDGGANGQYNPDRCGPALQSGCGIVEYDRAPVDRAHPEIRGYQSTRVSSGHGERCIIHQSLTLIIYPPRRYLPQYRP
jgi:hypothetical protein